jgi:hypothetical protein
LQIQAGGQLQTKERAHVHNFIDTGVNSSVLNRVSYDGGSTLTIGDEGDLAIADIEKLLGYITPLTIARSAAGQTGKPSSLVLVKPLANIQPSDINGITGIQALRTLAVTPGKAETTKTITIPVGAVVKVPTDKLGSVTELIVNGTLDAPQATGDVTDGVKITVAKGALLAVENVKVAANSTTAGEIIGGLTGLPITPAPGAIINGFVSTGTDPVTFINDTTTATAITVPAGETVQFGKGTFAAIPGIAVEAGGFLSIPAGTVVTPTAAATFAIAGTVTVGGAFNFISSSQTTGLSGTIEVLKGGSTSDVNGSGSLWGGDGSTVAYSTGKYVYHTGSKASLGADGGTVRLVDDVNNTDAILALTAGNLTLTRNRYELNGAAILKQEFGISEGMTLDIPANSVLTIPSGSQLNIHGNAVIAGTVTGSVKDDEVSKIVTTAASVTTITGKSNFYRVEGEEGEETVTTLSSLPAGKTYTWTTSDDGKSAGWVESDE